MVLALVDQDRLLNSAHVKTATTSQGLSLRQGICGGKQVQFLSILCLVINVLFLSFILAKTKQPIALTSLLHLTLFLVSLLRISSHPKLSFYHRYPRVWWDVGPNEDPVCRFAPVHNNRVPYGTSAGQLHTILVSTRVQSPTWLLFPATPYGDQSRIA